MLVTCLKESPWLQSRLKPSPKIVFLKVTVRSEEICSASAFAKSVAPSLSLYGVGVTICPNATRIPFCDVRSTVTTHQNTFSRFLC